MINVPTSKHDQRAWLLSLRLSVVFFPLSILRRPYSPSHRVLLLGRFCLLRPPLSSLACCICTPFLAYTLHLSLSPSLPRFPHAAPDPRPPAFFPACFTRHPTGPPAALPLGV